MILFDSEIEQAVGAYGHTPLPIRQSPGIRKF